MFRRITALIVALFGISGLILMTPVSAHASGESPPVPAYCQLNTSYTGTQFKDGTYQTGVDMMLSIVHDSPLNEVQSKFLTVYPPTEESYTLPERENEVTHIRLLSSGVWKFEAHLVGNNGLLPLTDDSTCTSTATVIDDIVPAPVSTTAPTPTLEPTPTQTPSEPAPVPTKAAPVPTPTSAEPVPTKPAAAPVVAFLNNLTDPSVKNKDGSYPVGSLFDLALHVTDPDNQVKVVHVYAQDPDGIVTDLFLDKAGNAEAYLHEAGDWTFYALLSKDNGLELTTTPAGGTVIHLTAKDAAVTTTPTPTPTQTADTPAPTPTSDGPTEDPDLPAPAPTYGDSGTVAPVVANGVATSAALPFTGDYTAVLALVAMAMLMLGAFLMFVARKRRDPKVLCIGD